MIEKFDANKKEEAVDESKVSPVLGVKTILFSILVLLLSATAGILALHPEWVTIVQNGLCSPAMPGLTLFSATQELKLEAPWWSPNAFKKDAFQLVCGTDRLRTALTWAPTNVGSTHCRFSLAEADTEKGLLVNRKKVQSAKINAGDIVLEYDKKKPEHITTVWRKK